MKLSSKIEKFLTDKKIKYRLLEHRVVYTGNDKAATLRMAPKTVGKTLVIKFNNHHGLVLIPADKLLCLAKTKKALNNWLKKNSQKPVKKIDFVKEAWMKKNLKGVEVGAIPPFGEIWKLATLADKSLIKAKKLIVNIGQYNLSIEIAGQEFKKLNNLIEASFSKAKPKKRKSTQKKKPARKKLTVSRKKRN